MSKTTNDDRRWHCVRKMPYRVRRAGERGLVLTLHGACGLNLDDRVLEFTDGRGEVLIRRVDKEPAV